MAIKYTPAGKPPVNMQRIRTLENFPQRWDDENRKDAETAPAEKAKQPSPQSIRFPQEVLDFFGYKTPGWQKRVNDVLLEYVAVQNRKNMRALRDRSSDIMQEISALLYDPFGGDKEETARKLNGYADELEAILKKIVVSEAG